MTTMTQLFKIVTNNDYDSLEKLVMSNKRPDFNCIKSGQSLVSKAIEVRSLECFNMLMGLTDLTVLQSTRPYISGLGTAVEYYSSAPNSSNQYYLERLLEKNVYIDIYTLTKCVDEPGLFEKMFARVDKNSSNMMTLVTSAINKTNMQLLNKLYDYIQNQNVPFYDTPDKKNSFNGQVLRSAISANNIGAIEFLENIGHNIFKVDSSIGGNNTIPSIYYATVSNATIAFNYLYKKFEELKKPELDAIPQIKKIEWVFKNYYKNKKEFNDNLTKLLKLQIDWDDIHNVIADIYYSIYRDNTYISTYSPKRSFQTIASDQQLIYILLKTNKVKSNPFDKINTLKSDLNSMVNSNAKRFTQNQVIFADLKLALRKSKYLLNSFGFVEHAGLTEHFKLIFTDNNPVYETEKKAYLEEMEKTYTTGNEDKKAKPKVTRKKKTTDVEIDV